MKKIERQKLIDQGYYREVYNKLDELIEGCNKINKWIKNDIIVFHYERLKIDGLNKRLDIHIKHHNKMDKQDNKDYGVIN